MLNEVTGLSSDWVAMFIEQRPYWETDCQAAGQDVLRLMWKWPDSTESHFSAVNTVTYHFF